MVRRNSTAGGRLLRFYSEARTIADATPLVDRSLYAHTEKAMIDQASISYYYFINLSVESIIGVLRNDGVMNSMEWLEIGVSN